MSSQTRNKRTALPQSLVIIAVAGLLTVFVASCGDRHVVPGHEIYRGAIEPAANAGVAAAPAPGAVKGTVASGRLTLRLSPDRTQVTRIELALSRVGWTKKSGKVVTEVTMETCELDYDGPFAIAPSGRFTAPQAGIRGRFESPDRMSGTLQLAYHYAVGGTPGTPATHIPGTPDINLPDGSVIRGTPDINIPGTPGIEAEGYAVELGSWTWSLDGEAAAVGNRAGHHSRGPA